MTEFRLSVLLCICVFFNSCIFYDQEEREWITVVPEKTSKQDVLPTPEVEENNPILQKVHSEFPKPINSYPIIESSLTTYKKDGLLYRNGVKHPFTGRVHELHNDGNLLMVCSFLNGKPHGMMQRLAPNGHVLMEAIFANGVLSGVRSKWWENGQLKEKEYWGDGQYKGRTNWDESGRLIKREVVPNS